MNTLTLPKLISDGMVLQHGKLLHMWGFDEPGRVVTVEFLNKKYAMVTDEEGCFSGYMDAAAPGGPYEMNVSDDAGASVTVKDILVGDVFFCSGQSNMELPIARVKDRFPEEVKACENDKVRTFKIIEHGEFHGPLKELKSGSWVSANADTIMNFSATGYFFTSQLYEMTGVPVGFINVSLGGSRLETWLSKEMIEAEIPYAQIPDYDLMGRSKEEYEAAKKSQISGWLTELEPYTDDAFVASQVKNNEVQSNKWHEGLDAADLGTTENWQEKTCAEDADKWEEIDIPFFFRDTKLKGFIGCVWFRKTFIVPEEMAGQPMHVWLGTIVDSDIVYVNGVMVGRTEYQYPPRKYEIPEGLLKAGENTIVIRVVCDNGGGRFTVGKKYAVWSETCEIDLIGTWQYRIGTTYHQVPPTDFVHWKPTVLYNGMTAPCHNYTIGGIVWYQGESNCENPDTYLDGLKMLIGGYRKMWNDESLPFYNVQLPNFWIDLPGSETSGWREVREKQRMAQAIPDSYMMVAYDLGEDNDLHPLNKKEVGRRLAVLAYEKEYRRVCQGESPSVHVVHVQTSERDGLTPTYEIQLMCQNAGSGLYAFSEEKGNIVKDFEIIDVDGKCLKADVQIIGNSILLSSEELTTEPAEVRYCYKDTNEGALIYNSYELPMSPFRMVI